MNHNTPSPPEDQSVRATKAELIAREAKEIVTSYSPEAIRAAEAVISELPTFGVREGNLVRQEGLDEQIRRKVGEYVAGH